jgi:Uma2 family endonuclease
MHDAPAPRRGIVYRRAPEPVHFPEEGLVPESKRHLKLRTLLFQLLERRLAAIARIGSDQFVYWNASNPKRCLAPDVFLRRGGPDETFGSWKTWERGAPELAVEIASESEEDWDETLARYQELGVLELVRFEESAPVGARLRVWDRVQGDLVERALEVDAAESNVLGAFFVVAPADDLPVSLRVAATADGGGLWATAEEDRRAEEGARREAERARDEAARRVTELEAELARRQGR